MRLALIWSVIIIGSLLVGIGSECCAPFPTEAMPHHCAQCLSKSAQVAIGAPVVPRHTVLIQEYIPIATRVLPNDGYPSSVTFAENTSPSEPLVNLALRI